MRGKLNKLICAMIVCISILSGYSLKSNAATFKLNAGKQEGGYKSSNIGVIGLRYVHRSGGMSKVVEVYPNTPASSAGIQVGDKIVAVDGLEVRQYNANQVHSMIAGPPGAPVTLTFYRCTVNNCGYKDITLTRMEMNNIQSDRIFKIYRYGK